MEVELVNPQGYCAGVLNAINIALKARKDNPSRNVFVLGMLVHNKLVIDELNAKGITTLPDSDCIPESIKQEDILIFTAHGHNESLDQEAKRRGLIIYDCTCPIVSKNTSLIKEEINKGHEVIYIGQKNHKETKASLSISSSVKLFDINDTINFKDVKDVSPLVVNQTTLNFLSLENIHKQIKLNIPQARIQNEICAATRLRQEAVLKINPSCDLIIIVGDKLSSNSNKLFEIACSTFKNKKIYMVENLQEIKAINLTGNKKATICSGASTPMRVVDEIKNYLLNYDR